MARRAAVPAALTIAPFLGREAVSGGLLTRDLLRSSAWRRLYRGVYADASLPLDHRLRCRAPDLSFRPVAPSVCSVLPTSGMSAV